MFAPPIKTSKTTTTSQVTPTRSHKRPQRESPSANRREDLERTTGVEIGPSASWRFSNPPRILSERIRGLQPPFWSPTPRLHHPIQANLKLGAIGEPLEHEADRVADQVMQTSASRLSASTSPQPIADWGARLAETAQAPPTRPAVFQAASIGRAPD